jgi:hypothetical protein
MPGIEKKYNWVWFDLNVTLSSQSEYQCDDDVCLLLLMIYTWSRNEHTDGQRFDVFIVVHNIHRSMETYILAVLSERKDSSIPVAIDKMIIDHFM